MLKIYHVNGTRGTRVIWLCEELEVPYEIETVSFAPEFRASPEWRARNPVGKVPAMTDGDVSLFESGAMMDYVLARYGEGRLVPPVGSQAHAHYLQWHWFAEATLARPLGEIVNHGREFPGEQRIAAVVNEMADRSVVCLNAVADAVGDNSYILGETFTAADISLGYSLMLGQMLIPERFPEALTPYWERLAARSGFQIAREA